MSKARATIGINGRPLPILPPERDARVWAKLVRVMFYTPGFLAMLLLKAGEPEGFGQGRGAGTVNVFAGDDLHGGG